MKLLESNAYIADLKCAIKNIDLSSLEGKTIFITGLNKPSKARTSAVDVLALLFAEFL